MNLSAIDRLCHAGKYLVESRGMDANLKISDWPNTPDYNACRIISIALCEIAGASPVWIQKAKADL
jgi:hypothetical protein